MIEAAKWYEGQQADLGKRFLTCIQDSINRIALNPLLYPFFEGAVRRCLVKTFPFGILFRADKDTLMIMAVMHLHREPGYWQNRSIDI